ncbi:heparan-alpha-glucosaminide N-acetyltransferase domain-containing protein [Roseibacillus ishigakijimensis]|uniref:DUF1624 domain-containing protein n=1 Tax=Roseibacillus ishigakijimensis TaxID=454146 RepID=A0A934VMI3_9BACT|nr:heparan-alpha-glucosaminide N-acetyltransferase domain-containing protein [Roseibacillus ishigakijimensis]MBK1834121.1 DUF1624 domain-containing protein [Roseibacillus ishigakijimensis]
MSEGRKERIVFIDLLRGYAILMMLQGHTIGVVLREELQNNRYPAHFVWWYLKGLTAPTFFTAAGLIFAYLLLRSAEQGGDRIGKGLKRGLQLMVLGWVLRISPDFVKDLFAGEWSRVLAILGKSYVFHSIGIAIILLILLWLLCRPRGKIFALAVLLLGQLILLFGPWAETWAPESGGGRVLGTFFSRQYAAFPLLPYLGYAFTGAGLGAWAWVSKWYRSPRAFGVLIAAGALTMALSGPLHEGAKLIMEGLFSLSPEAAVYGRHWRTGEVLVLTGLIGLLSLWLTKKEKLESRPVQWVTRCGQETLTIFFLHHIVVYSGIFGFGLSSTLRHALGVPGSLLTAGLVWAGFILLAMNLTALRKKFPPLRLLR